MDQAWARYYEASQLGQGMARTMLLFVLYLAAMWAIGYFVLPDEYIHPCGGLLSCRVDWLMTFARVGVLLNLAVFDAVMLCR